MGLAFRIIPTILCRGRAAFKGKQFAGARGVGHVAQQLRVYAKRGIDECLLLDIAATESGRTPDMKMVGELSEGLFCPLTVGGGVYKLAQALEVVAAGADKVAIGTAFLEHPKCVTEIADAMGRQAVVAVITYYTDDTLRRRGAVHVSKVAGYAAAAQERGAGEVVLNCMDRDGMMQGYDLPTLESVARVADIPVIALGGCGKPDHVLQAVDAGASGAAIGSMFLFEDVTPSGVAKYLNERKVEVRL